MMKNNQALAGNFWMPFRKLAKASAGIQNGGHFLTRLCIVVEFFHSLIGYCIANYQIAFRLLPCTIAAAVQTAGKTA
jgi:hypothetical protein